MEDAEEVQAGSHRVLHEEDQDLNRTSGRRLTPRDHLMRSETSVLFQVLVGTKVHHRGKQRLGQIFGGARDQQPQYQSSASPSRSSSFTSWLWFLHLTGNSREGKELSRSSGAAVINQLQVEALMEAVSPPGAPMRGGTMTVAANVYLPSQELRQPIMSQTAAVQELQLQAGLQQTWRDALKVLGGDGSARDGPITE